MFKDYDIKKAKLIIWDLDDTFWNGTLSEGGISFNQENLQLIQELTDRGIMNSICSKNDFLNVKTQFIIQGYINYWKMFLFPSIDWSSKGQRVKQIIENMQLRAENVIVIDDNETNINEIKYYCPNIMSAPPEYIKKIADELYLVNDYDFEHLRLKQYKILETKNSDKINSNVSNEEFLRHSNIKICIKKDCEKNIDRIEKMILRTNQLNFTKKRVDKAVLENIFANKTQYDSGYVIAEDKYGNYGICGFYTINKNDNSLEHFLFSCRIMNMGIEQFVYKYLNSPSITIIPPVSSQLDTCVDWIKVVDDIEIKENKKKSMTNLNILFKGACDLYSTINYIDGDCNIDTEFPYWNKKLLYISSHTHPAFIEQTNRLSQEEIISLTKTFPYPQPDEFKTEFFNPKYNVVILSLLQVALRGIYINKTNGTFAEYGFTGCDVTNENNWDEVMETIPEKFKDENRKILSKFKQEYEFAGNPPVDLVIKNLKYIREHLNENTNLILILGSEIDTQKIIKGYEGACEKHKLLNKQVREFAKQYNNIDLIEITDFIKSDDDYTECINHFSRKIYVDIAREVANITNKRLGSEHLFLKVEKELAGV